MISIPWGPRTNYIQVISVHTLVASFVLPLALLAGSMNLAFAVDSSRFGKFSRPVPAFDANHSKVLVEIAAAIASDLTPRRSKQRNSQVNMLQGRILHYAGLWSDSIGVFNRVIASEENYETEQAWLMLAKIFVQLKNYKNALTALAQIHSELPARLSDQRWLLMVDSLLQNGQLDQAKVIVLSIPDGSIALPYAQYNLALALIKQQKYDNANSLLWQVARLKGDTLEHHALRNRANMAIVRLQTMLNRDNYRHKNHDSNNSDVIFDLLNTNKPVSRQALLQVGWAWYHNGEYKNAIASWYPLQTGNPKHPMVQEALLAIPAAFVALNKQKNAAFHYDRAIDAYRKTHQALEQTIEIVGAGEFQRGLKAIDAPVADALLNMFALDTYDFNPTTVARPFLADLIVSNDFQNAVRAYQIFKTMKHFVIEKNENLPAIYQTIQKQTVELKKHISDVPGVSPAEQFQYLQAKRKQLTRQLMSIATSKAPANQRKRQEDEIIANLDVVQARIELLESRETENKVGETLSRESLLLSQGQLDQLRDETRHFEKTVHLNLKVLDIVISQQENYLHRMVLNALNLYKTRLKHFMQRALFGKARVYDMLATSQSR